jgi:hypothetical protein
VTGVIPLTPFCRGEILKLDETPPHTSAMVGTSQANSHSIDHSVRTAEGLDKRHCLLDVQGLRGY